MYARAVDDAAKRLRELRSEEWAAGAMALLAVAASIAVSHHHPGLALGLFVGGAVTAIRAFRATLDRWELVERLKTDRDAYAISEVRRQAAKAAADQNRRRLAAEIRSLLAAPGFAAAPRIEACALPLRELADELDDPSLALDPVAAVACERLLGEGLASPLFNSALPAVDLWAAIRRIQAGFAPRTSSR